MAAVVCMASSGFASAAPHAVKDLRTSTDADGIAREISFCARPTPGSPVPGHAFVAFSTLDKGSRQFTTVGHTTLASKVDAILTYTAILPSVPGLLSEEHYTSVKEKCLVLKVNKDAYEAAMAAAQPALSRLFPSGNKPLLLAYTLGSNDCLGFMIGVARSFGAKVKIPVRGSTELPLAYLRNFIDTNQ